MAKFNSSAALLAVAVFFCYCCGCHGEAKPPGGNEESVDVSPRCAAALLSGAMVGSAGIAYAITPTVLCSAGFCTSGVAGGSFASWWQRTMPFVKSGSLFASLQSVAMSGIGAKATVTGGIVGGALGLGYLKSFCTYVDDPNSTLAPFLDSTHEAVKELFLAKDQVQQACAASKSCTAVKDLAMAASATVSSSISSAWDYLSGGIEHVAETVSTQREIWLLEKEIVELKERLVDLIENTYGGWVFLHSTTLGRMGY